MSDDRETIIRYRMERAAQTLADAEILARAGSWNSCVNRLYYACFHAISALLLRDGLASAKHTDVRSLFNERFVRTGMIAQDLGTLYNDLFRDRQDADYVDLVDFEERQVRPLIAEARRFVARVEELLQSS
jgi:uncharacterized protein